MFNVCLKRMLYAILAGVFYNCQLDQDGQLHFGPLVLSIPVKKILKYPTVVMGLSPLFRSICFCFMYFEILLLANKHLRLLYPLDTLTPLLLWNVPLHPHNIY